MVEILGKILFFIATFLSFGCALLLLKWLAQYQRRRKLVAWAFANGLAFSTCKQKGFDIGLFDFPCFEHEDHCADNIMAGRLGKYGFLAFDYHPYYHTPAKSNSIFVSLCELFDLTTEIGFSAIILTSPVQLEPLQLRPLQKFEIDLFGKDKVEFESAEFNQMFDVRAKDRRWAYDVIHPRAMELLLATRYRFHIQMHDTRILIHYNERLSTRGFAAGARIGIKLLDIMPPYLVNQQMESAECQSQISDFKMDYK